MMESQSLELLNRKLTEEVRVLQENLGGGGAKDFAEYQNLCGVIRGLLTAQREINDLLRKLKDLDND
jgi:hypothetical protein